MKKKAKKIEKSLTHGPVRESNPGPLAPMLIEFGQLKVQIFKSKRNGSQLVFQLDIPVVFKYLIKATISKATISFAMAKLKAH